MDTNYQKKLAAKILKCGVSRIRVDPSKEVEEALTREDVRGLIKKGLIKKVQKRGASRANTRKIMAQKIKGRMKGVGSKKGTRKARNPQKNKWMESVRSLRSLLSSLKEDNMIDNKTYKNLYRKIKGGFFRNKHHLMMYMKDEGLIKKNK